MKGEVNKFRGSDRHEPLELPITVISRLAHRLTGRFIKLSFRSAGLSNLSHCAITLTRRKIGVRGVIGTEHMTRVDRYKAKIRIRSDTNIGFHKNMWRIVEHTQFKEKFTCLSHIDCYRCTCTYTYPSPTSTST